MSTGITIWRTTLCSCQGPPVPSWSQEGRGAWKSQTSCSGSVTALQVPPCRLGNLSVTVSPCSFAPKPSFHSAAVHPAIPDARLPVPQTRMPAWSSSFMLPDPLATADLLDNLSGRDFYCPTHSAPVVTDVVSHRRLQMRCTPGTASMGPRGACS